MAGLASALHFGKYLFINNHLTHWAWAQNMQYRTLADAVMSGRVFAAVENVAKDEVEEFSDVHQGEEEHL